MEIKAIFFLIVIVFSVIQSIMKAAKEKAQKQQQLMNPRPERRQKAQSEIEAFLAQVTGGAGAAQAVDPREEEERQRRKRDQAEARKRRQLEQKRKQQVAERRTSAARSQGGQPKKKKRSGIADHVDEYITKHVNTHLDHDVNEYVEATIVDGVDGHLGRRENEMPALTVTRHENTAAANNIAKLLRSPSGIRNAILVNEILSRPAALRRP